MKNTLKIFNIEKRELTFNTYYEIAVICNNCNKIFQYNSTNNGLIPVICPFCKSKRRGTKLWQRNHS